MLDLELKMKRDAEEIERLKQQNAALTLIRKNKQKNEGGINVKK
jgi:hypothetical protein